MNANLKGWLQALQLRIQFYEMVFLHEDLEYDFFFSYGLDYEIF